MRALIYVFERMKVYCESHTTYVSFYIHVTVVSRTRTIQIGSSAKPCDYLVTFSHATTNNKRNYCTHIRVSTRIYSFFRLTMFVFARNHEPILYICKNPLFL